MSVSAISSSSSSIASLLGQNSASSTASSLLGTSSSSTDAVTVDLSNYAQAASSGDTSGKTASLNQLKQELVTEQTSLLSTLTGSDTSMGDTGDSLLSSLYGSSATSSSGSILDTIA